MDNADLSSPDMQGVGQTIDGNVIELVDAARRWRPDPPTPDLARYLQPEPFIESDDPEIVAEAERLVQGVTGTRARAERLTREVNALLDKKPTVSLPSAREVLRTRVGDCNEHTVLFVAMARALGIPARINVGLVFVHGAFYYHAWPDVYIDEGKGRGQWLPVDPTFNQFPADATHVRLARGGLDKQAAILPLIGRVKMTVLDVELAPNSTPDPRGPRARPTPASCRSTCRNARTVAAGRGPAEGHANDRRAEPRQAVRQLHGRGRRVDSTCSRGRSTASSGRTARARPRPSASLPACSSPRRAASS